MDIKNSSFNDLLKASLKSKDTEEWLDVYFTRPIGLAFAIMWYHLGVKPNTITILSIFLGVGAGIMFYFTNFWYNLLGVCLLMLANFCDSTDGQLARLTNQRSIVGRCLDGFAGDVWFFSIYLAIVLRIWFTPIPLVNLPWGILGFVLALIAGVYCHARQSSLSDYYRQIHLYFLKGKEGSELDSYAEEQKIVAQLKGKKNVFWGRMFHTNYMRYCKSQEQRTPHFQALHKALMARYGNINLVPHTIKEAFLHDSRKLMPLTNFLTFNSRAIIIYITCLLDMPWVYLLIEITLYSMVYFYMKSKHENLSKQLLNTLKNETRA